MGRLYAAAIKPQARRTAQGIVWLDVLLVCNRQISSIGFGPAGCKLAARWRLSRDVVVDSNGAQPARARTRADARRDGLAVPATHGALRRRGRLLHGILSRPRHIAFGAIHPALHHRKSN